MNKTVNILLRLVCLIIYGAAIASGLTDLPPGSQNLWRNSALVLLGLHGLEVFIAFNYIKKYRGPLMISIGLTLLFGLLHWMPLKKQT